MIRHSNAFLMLTIDLFLTIVRLPWMIRQAVAFEGFWLLGGIWSSASGLKVKTGFVASLNGYRGRGEASTMTLSDLKSTPPAF
jgi:hypothetical protein